MNRRKSPIYKSPGLSPNIKPGLFSNPSELNKLNKQKTVKVDESQSPLLKESKETKIPPKLQKSYRFDHLFNSSATKLFSNNIRVAKQQTEDKDDKIMETLQKLLKELIEFNDNIEQSQVTNIEEWCCEILEKLNQIKANIERKEDHSACDAVMQQEILTKLLKELQEEKKERYRIEEEATNLITEQEIEINRLEKELRLLEEKHQLQ
ncbi:unnamed protein product (macronuclear) [Paramecium tetraurelia]|uniref:Uncharacterized protein n=1 Tax=Paramecium tetraurelia TaxID=5888 RepID=A0BQ21_PARTE|nr:uncharacterized protein GSPATT00005389001 [Paramecium tetraurelia]CAK60638.1 unnamed protein product [Paramecium tetraurelia]|eukprot:XP_001428036.1 hypothetical protein (macronuclear) [Paramecium tetraurelia strain d4-2]